MRTCEKCADYFHCNLPKKPQNAHYGLQPVNPKECLANEGEKKNAQAVETLDKWCKECTQDTFGQCEDDCGIHELRQTLANKKGENTK